MPDNHNIIRKCHIVIKRLLVSWCKDTNRISIFKFFETFL
ncbi:hypothetical protein BSCG_00629 [Bacteroides sp. 2_2_4]|uniref:Uncharacterized protein n=1 Tax=Bacteroides ovatus (strain ATCC 8483 / DSM 1896 / JCM 5824 / BCRC 10623 / CCUG 4943 / NCTC 11153) TaxID=411476 RepID=A0AAN3A557_BACO1|nr:hypothetical protein BACOVA_04580 [Bacteroides ovatus ATCC 8483]EEO53705.1 hypothetical protein BSCG_00629 [Bacteroides sp. 2_2_4]